MRLHTTHTTNLLCLASQIDDHKSHSTSTRRQPQRLASRAEPRMSQSHVHVYSPVSPHPDALYRRRMAQQRYGVQQGWGCSRCSCGQTRDPPFAGTF